MVKKCARIVDGVVTNVELWEDVDTPFVIPNSIVVDVTNLTAGIGWLYDGSAFSEPPPETEDPIQVILDKAIADRTVEENAQLAEYGAKMARAN